MLTAYLAVLIAAFSGASVPVFSKVALAGIPPFTLVTIRFLLASVSLLPFVIKAKQLNLPTFKKLYWVGLIGALNPILLFIALQFTRASWATLIYAISPAITALILYFHTKQVPTSKQIIGIILGFVGVWLIILLPMLNSSWDLISLLGNLLIFGAALAFVFYGVFSKQALNQSTLPVSPISLTFYFCLMTLIAALPFAIGESLTRSDYLNHVTSYQWLASLWIGLVGTSLFYYAYQFALKRSTPVIASLFTYIQPIIAVILAVIFLGESISVLFIIGSVLALIGANLATRR